MLPLGTIAPAFNLADTVSGKKLSLSELKSDKITLVMFICNHCPFVKHVNPELVRLAKEYMPKGVSFIAINSNDIASNPDDAPDKMTERAKELGYPFPYLFDATQEVAKAYDAACTPDFFIFDADLKLVYRGQLDDSRPSNTIPLSGKDIKAAFDNILQGIAVSKDQTPSIGCNIKWKE